MENGGRNVAVSLCPALPRKAEKYAAAVVLSTLWHAQRNPALTSEQQQTIFDSRLDGMELYTPEAPDMEEESSPTMGLSL